MKRPHWPAENWQYRGRVAFYGRNILRGRFGFLKWVLTKKLHRWVLKKWYKQTNCQHCGSFGAKYNPLTVDHIIPISHGGPDTLRNKQILCRKCNVSKGDRADYTRPTKLATYKAFMTSIAKKDR